MDLDVLENVGRSSDFFHSWSGVVYEQDFSGFDEIGVGASDDGSGKELSTQLYYVFGFNVLVDGDVEATHRITNSTLDTSCSTDTF